VRSQQAQGEVVVERAGGGRCVNALERVVGDLLDDLAEDLVAKLTVLNAGVADLAHQLPQERLFRRREVTLVNETRTHKSGRGWWCQGLGR